jgi:hypothetical protein
MHFYDFVEACWPLLLSDDKEYYVTTNAEFFFGYFLFSSALWTERAKSDRRIKTLRYVPITLNNNIIIILRKIFDGVIRLLHFSAAVAYEPP